MKLGIVAAAGAAFVMAAPAYAADVITFEGSNTTTQYAAQGIIFDNNFTVRSDTFGGAVDVPSGSNYLSVDSSGATIRFANPSNSAQAATTDMFGFTIAGLNSGGGFYAGAVVSLFDLGGNLIRSQQFDPVGPNESRSQIKYSTSAPGIASVRFDRIANPQGGALFPIDDVTFGALSAGGVPEPSVWAFLILGFGAIGGAMRRSARTRVQVRYAA